MAVARTRTKDPLVDLEHHDVYPDARIRAIPRQVRAMAMVGASTVWRRPSAYAMKHPRNKGFRVIPANSQRRTPR